MIVIGAQRPEIAGSRSTVCSKCGALVWLDPAAQRLVERVIERVRVVCLGCAPS